MESQETDFKQKQFDSHTLDFQITVGILITVAMGNFKKINKRRHPNNRRHGTFPKVHFFNLSLTKDLI